MPTREIVCAYCGEIGKIDVWGMNEDIASPAMFKYLGHNPFSGHMHFQCPNCNIVSLVSPSSVLGNGIITSDYHPFEENERGWRRLFPQGEETFLPSAIRRRN
jgi:hypothetical protein